jgi:hypothetical protein
VRDDARAADPALLRTNDGVLLTACATDDFGVPGASFGRIHAGAKGIAPLGRGSYRVTAPRDVAARLRVP